MLILTLRQARSIAALCTDHDVDDVTVDRPIPRRNELRAIGHRDNTQAFVAIVDTDGNVRTVSTVPA